MKYQKPLGIGVLILSAGIFVFSACRLAAYVMENQAQEVAFEDLGKTGGRTVVGCRISSRR